MKFELYASTKPVSRQPSKTLFRGCPYGMMRNQVKIENPQGILKPGLPVDVELP